MGERDYKRSERHEELANNVGFSGQLKFAQAELICFGLLHIGNAIYRVAESLSPVNEPKWAKRLERKMSEQSDAIARVEANLSGVTSEIDDVVSVLQDLQSRVDDPALTQELNSLADRLATAKDTLENATTLDDPAPEPDPTPTPDPAPVDPGAGDQPGDQPPVDQPPIV